MNKRPISTAKRPLSIANLTLLKKKFNNETEFVHLKKSLWRISDMLKKMEQLMEKETLPFENYGEASQILKLMDK